MPGGAVRDLRVDRHALVAQLGGPVEDQAPAVELGVGLHHREREAGTGVRGQPAEQLELGVRGLAHLAVHAARDDLEHAGAELAQHARQRGELGFVGERARHLVAPARVVGEDA